MDTPMLIVSSSSNLHSRSRLNVMRPSDSHQFLIPNLSVSTTSMNSMNDIQKANSYRDIGRHSSGSSLLVPHQYSRILRNRPSVTSENVITGMKPFDGGERRRDIIPSTPFFDCRSNTFPYEHMQKLRRTKKKTQKEIKRIALYERAGDTYGNIVGRNVGVSLTPYGFPVLEDSPRDCTDESTFHTFNFESVPKPLIKPENSFHPLISSTTTMLSSSEDEAPIIDVTIKYDETGLISLSSLKLHGIQENRRVIVRADLASHLRKKRRIGPLVSANETYEHNKDVVFFRAKQSHLELSQMKLTVHTEKHKFGRRTLVGSVTISLLDLLVGQTTYSRPLHPILPHVDLGRLRLVLCYHVQKRRLLVTVVRATNLPRKIISPDSVVTVELRGSNNSLRATAQTKVKRFTNNPVYKEVFSFDLPPRSMEDWDFTDIQHPLDDITLTVTVHRKKLLFADDVIGKVVLKSEMRTNGYSHLWKCKRSPYQPITEWHDLKSSPMPID